MNRTAAKSLTGCFNNPCPSLQTIARVEKQAAVTLAEWLNKNQEPPMDVERARELLNKFAEAYPAIEKRLLRRWPK